MSGAWHAPIAAVAVLRRATVRDRSRPVPAATLKSCLRAAVGVRRRRPRHDPTDLPRATLPRAFPAHPDLTPVRGRPLRRIREGICLDRGKP